jgi:hypothetical protein
VLCDHLQDVRVSASGSKCSVARNGRQGCQQLPRFALNQNGKGCGTKCNGPGLVHHKITPRSSPCGYDPVFEEIGIKPLAKCIDAIVREQMVAMIE